MAKRGKLVNHEGIVGDIGSAYTDVQELRDEVREVVENAGENLSQTQRIQTLSETADTLDGSADDEPTVPEGLENLKISYSTFHAYGRKGDSRATRMMNAVALMDGVIDALNEFIEDADAPIDNLVPEGLDGAFMAISEEQLAESDKRAEALKNEAETLRDEIENAKGEFEGVEFRGMYG